MNCTKRTRDGDIVSVPLCASFVFTIVESVSLARCNFNVLPKYTCTWRFWCTSKYDIHIVIGDIILLFIDQSNVCFITVTCSSVQYTVSVYLCSSNSSNKH